jgi:hypothetical protein
MVFWGVLRNDQPPLAGASRRMLGALSDDLLTHG